MNWLPQLRSAVTAMWHPNVHFKPRLRSSKENHATMTPNRNYEKETCGSGVHLFYSSSSGSWTGFFSWFNNSQLRKIIPIQNKPCWIEYFNVCWYVASQIYSEVVHGIKRFEKLITGTFCTYKMQSCDGLCSLWRVLRVVQCPNSTCECTNIDRHCVSLYTVLKIEGFC